MGELVGFFDLTPGFRSWEVLADLGLIGSFCVRVFAIYTLISSLLSTQVSFFTNQLSIQCIFFV